MVRARSSHALSRNLLIAEAPLWKPLAWQSIRTARAARRIGAKQKLAEFAPLVALVARKRPETVLEIGTFRGGSLYAWCRAASPTATLISVDLPGGAFGGGYGVEEIPKLEAHGRDRQELHLLRVDSHALSTRGVVLDALAGRPLDFVMIDGDHSYAGVRQDFELYSPLVAPGGLIAFHDTLPHTGDPDCEVDKLWKQLKPHYDHCEFLDAQNVAARGQWGGIGVLFWPQGSQEEDGLEPCAS